MTRTDHAATTMRTHRCGALRSTDVGTVVRVGGWVHGKRNLGGHVFLDLRDRDGIIQASFDPAVVGVETLELAAAVGRESVVLVEGEVVARPPEGRNTALATGDVEIKARALRVLGPATTPAIPVARTRGEPLPAEEQRLRHRYLDLRRPELM
ncbi:MAG: OB-fold nucleic acid binding domain-containing protein, partial [Gemmatimonadaceae bacterium]